MKNDPLDEMSEAELIDRFGEVRQFICDLRRDDREILQKLAWGNKLKIEGSAYRAVKRQTKRQFTLKRHDDGRPVACDLPENVRVQIFEPPHMTEIIYVSSNVKKR